MKEEGRNHLRGRSLNSSWTGALHDPFPGRCQRCKSVGYLGQCAESSPAAREGLGRGGGHCNPNTGYTRDNQTRVNVAGCF